MQCCGKEADGSVHVGWVEAERHFDVVTGS